MTITCQHLPVFADIIDNNFFQKLRKQVKKTFSNKNVGGM